MTTLHVSLPDSMKDFVESQAATEGFGSPSEYLRSVIGQVQKRQAKQALDAKLLEGLDGPAVEMTTEDWDDIEREAQARFDHAKAGE